MTLSRESTKITDVSEICYKYLIFFRLEVIERQELLKYSAFSERDSDFFLHLQKATAMNVA